MNKKNTEQFKAPAHGPEVKWQMNKYLCKKIYKNSLRKARVCGIKHLLLPSHLLRSSRWGLLSRLLQQRTMQPSPLSSQPEGSSLGKQGFTFLIMRPLACCRGSVPVWYNREVRASSNLPHTWNIVSTLCMTRCECWGASRPCLTHEVAVPYWEK